MPKRHVKSKYALKDHGMGIFLDYGEVRWKPLSRGCRNSLSRGEILNLNHRTPASFIATLDADRRNHLSKI